MAVEEDDGERTYLYIKTAEGLVSLVQMGALEVHVWGSRVDRIEQPDRMVFDLDPSAGSPVGARGGRREDRAAPP